MARIRTYALDDNVTGSDYWIGTDGNNNSNTKNFSPNSVAKYLNENEVVDVSNSIRFRYDTIDSGKPRMEGTLSFATEIGAVVPINSLTTFILSKNTQSTKLVSAFLNILPGTKIILQKSDYINIFGIFKVISVTQIELEPDFYTVVVQYISGYGSLEEDKDYVISLIDTSEEQNLQQVTDKGSTTTNSITANSFIKINGTSSQFLKANGSVDSTVYTTAQNLQQVTNLGASTTNSITANSFIKIGGTGENVLLDDGDTIALTSIESATTSPITADLEVGGIADQQIIPTGTNLQEFATLLLNKTYYPELINPTFSLTSNAGVREIGSSTAFTLTFTYDDGNILGATVGGVWLPTGSQGGRSGPAISYTINGTTQAGNTLSVSPILLSGGNPFSGTVTYGAGIQPLDSKGFDYDEEYPAGTSPIRSVNIQGIYPYFWYKSTSPITSAGMQTAIASGVATKVLSSSTGTITIDFDAVGEYLAVAYPSASTTKTVWYVTALDNGFIPGGVFGAVVTLPCTSPAIPTPLWSNVSYKIHVTAGPISRLDPMQLRNS